MLYMYSKQCETVDAYQTMLSEPWASNLAHVESQFAVSICTWMARRADPSYYKAWDSAEQFVESQRRFSSLIQDRIGQILR